MKLDILDPNLGLGNGYSSLLLYYEVAIWILILP